MKPLTRRWRRILLAFLLYLTFCAVGGVYLADATLHLARRPLTDGDVAAMRQAARAPDAPLEDVAITARDGAVLRGWTLRPLRGNRDAVILLHGMGDNRLGMMGYAQLFLAHGFTVLMPDARAHGVSGGALATYGLLERNDIRRWFDFLSKHDAPRCIFGFGESMGAAELLQSLADTPFCAVAAESSFATFREIAYDRMGQPFHLGPWMGRTLLRPLVETAFLRARWKYGLNMDRVSPADSVAATDIPVLLIHGELDSNIPVRHSRLIQARNSAARLWEVAGADHCGAITAAPEELERMLLGWLKPRNGSAKLLSTR